MADTSKSLESWIWDPIPVPSLDEQSEIADIFAVLDQKEKVHGRKQGTLTDLFHTQLHELMTAKVRVRDLAIPKLDTMP